MQSSATYFGHYTLLLSSEGGSLVDALEIANFVADRFISTRVEDGGPCLSSVSYIFVWHEACWRWEIECHHAV